MNEEVEKDKGEDSKEIDKNYIPGRPYSRLRRELSEDDLANPAVQKLIISDIDKLEARISDLEDFQEKFYATDKDKAVLEEKLKGHNSHEILYSFCLSAGSGLLGISSLFKIEEQGWIFLVIGGILIIGGILSKFVKWN
ncbi:MAG: hypothetical protein QY303_04325 [Vicingaceae bacterium]|nr:MAG: hypothetical protein QY303_04325 [Vicingaceae bacterium]